MRRGWTCRSSSSRPSRWPSRSGSRSSSPGSLPDSGLRDGPAHEPVMVDQVTGFLGGRGTVVDMTLGAGGHAEALLRSGVGHLLGFDRDPAAIAMASARLSEFRERVRATRARFSEVEVGEPVDGVLLDLGVSSMQLDLPE